MECIWMNRRILSRVSEGYHFWLFSSHIWFGKPHETWSNQNHVEQVHLIEWNKLTFLVGLSKKADPMGGYDWDRWDPLIRGWIVEIHQLRLGSFRSISSGINRLRSIHTRVDQNNWVDCGNWQPRLFVAKKKPMSGYKIGAFNLMAPRLAFTKLVQV